MLPSVKINPGRVLLALSLLVISQGAQKASAAGLCHPNPCGKGAECQDRNSLLVCVCPENTTGDPFESCRPDAVPDMSSSSSSSTGTASTATTTTTSSTRSTSASTHPYSHQTSSSSSTSPSYSNKNPHDRDRDRERDRDRTTTSEVTEYSSSSSPSSTSNYNNNNYYNPNKPVLIDTSSSRRTYSSNSNSPSSTTYSSNDNGSTYIKSFSSSSSHPGTTPETHSYRTHNNMDTNNRDQDRNQNRDQTNRDQGNDHQRNSHDSNTGNNNSFMSRDSSSHSNNNEANTNGIRRNDQSPGSSDDRETVYYDGNGNRRVLADSNSHHERYSSNNHNSQNYNDHDRDRNSNNNNNGNNRDRFSSSSATSSTYSNNDRNSNYNSNDRDKDHDSNPNRVKDPLGVYTNCKSINGNIVCADNSDAGSGSRDKPHFISENNNNNDHSFRQSIISSSDINDFRNKQNLDRDRDSRPTRPHFEDNRNDYDDNYSYRHRPAPVRFQNNHHDDGGNSFRFQEFVVHSQEPYLNSNSNRFGNDRDRDQDGNGKNQQNRFQNGGSVISSSSNNNNNHATPQAGDPDQCKKFCGQGAVCRSLLGRPICGCPEGYEGDASVKCYPSQDQMQMRNRCQKHTDCSEREVCENSQCLDPCKSGSSSGSRDGGSSSNFHFRSKRYNEFNDSGRIRSSNSNSNNYNQNDSHGSMYGSHNVRTSDSHGASNGGLLCGRNTKCQVVDHTPLCGCLQGYTGNPYTGCV